LAPPVAIDNVGGDGAVASGPVENPTSLRSRRTTGRFGGMTITLMS